MCEPAHCRMLADMLLGRAQAARRSRSAGYLQDLGAPVAPADARWGKRWGAGGVARWVLLLDAARARQGSHAVGSW